MSVFTDKVTKYNSRLMSDLQVDNVQACGIWGNLGTETGGFTQLQELKPVLAGSRGGYGWMQWTGPRRRKYEAWCKQNMFDPAADETNYKYLVHETMTDEAKSLVQLRKTKSLEAAAETFMKQNLRPGTPHLDSRINWARKAFEATKNVQKTDTQLGASAGAAAAGGAAMLTTPTRYWPWIAVATIVTIIVSWIVIHRYKEHQKLEELNKVTPKTAKKRKTNVQVKKG